MSPPKARGGVTFCWSIDCIRIAGCIIDVLDERTRYQEEGRTNFATGRIRGIRDGTQAQPIAIVSSVVDRIRGMTVVSGEYKVSELKFWTEKVEYM